MRPNMVTRTLVSLAAVAGLAAGGLVGAGSAFAQPASNSPTVAVSTKDVAPLAVNNLGLSTTEARYVQCWLQDYHGYNGALDGLLGSDSWKAMQRSLKAYWGYTGGIDGIVGSGTIKGLQRSMKKHQGYNGGIDGIAGPATKAAFKRFAADSKPYC
ncbi:peptidoglycan-binding domain-containing protein [Streptomyces sp. NPDC102274]|uniref:peptidoglycan-binding domain-containing protein n=1 Tax=Streptomyces sp. NPDC102274 TaxID=3366151 RepID=UPI0037F69516